MIDKTIKIDVISGFIGAGKTTVINKLLPAVTESELVAIIENEFGEIGIDGQVLGESGVNVQEIAGGCICCTLFGNFVHALTQMIEEYAPDRIIIEPTGLGKLSDVMKAFEMVAKQENVQLNILMTVVDIQNYDFYSQMFGEFFRDQISEANTILISRSQLVSRDEVDQCITKLAEINPSAQFITESLEDCSSQKLLQLLEDALSDVPVKAFSLKENLECGQMHHHEHGCECHHHDQEEEHHHEHSHFQDEENITSISFRMPISLEKEMLAERIRILVTEDPKGLILRGKGFVYDEQGNCYRFEYVRGSLGFAETVAAHEARVVFIGKNIEKEHVREIIIGG